MGHQWGGGGKLGGRLKEIKNQFDDQSVKQRSFSGEKNGEAPLNCVFPDENAP